MQQDKGRRVVMPYHICKLRAKLDEIGGSTMKCYDFSKYDKDLDMDAMATAPREEILAQLCLARALYGGLDAIIENSKDGFFITDGKGYVLRVNRSYEELSGLRREIIVGKHMTELEGDAITESASLIAIRTREPVTIEQKFFYTGRTAYITSSPIFDEDGEIVMVVSNNRDFGEIDELKNQLDLTRRKASEAESHLAAVRSQLYHRSDIVARDPKMLEVLYRAGKVAAADTTVLVTGETGTGKEEIAKFLHENSARREGPFLKLNCGAISENLIESELFGYEKGAFTGASSGGKMGYFEVANHGTLFLDELGELPLDLQVKLLRVLQEREVVRIGGTKPIKVDVRVVAATNRDLESMVAKKQFREDLYYRLNVVKITIPPLRERREDVAPLTEKFLAKYNERYHVSRTFTSFAMRAMEDYQWPGNVRELKNIVEQMVIMAESERISTADLPFYRGRKGRDPRFPELTEGEGTLDLDAVLEKIEYSYIKAAYEQGGSLKAAAEKLGMSLATCARKKKRCEQKYEK